MLRHATLLIHNREYELYVWTVTLPTSASDYTEIEIQFAPKLASKNREGVGSYSKQFSILADNTRRRAQLVLEGKLPPTPPLHRAGSEKRRQLEIREEYSSDEPDPQEGQSVIARHRARLIGDATYELGHILRYHVSRTEKEKELVGKKTKKPAEPPISVPPAKLAISACVFEPPPTHDEAGAEVLLFPQPLIVATCGASSVCRVNVETARVESIYVDPNETNFWALACTTVKVRETAGGLFASPPQSNSSQATPSSPSTPSFSVTVWAAAGDQGAIKLLDTQRQACYADIPAHTRPIRALCFSPAEPTLLLSGGADGNILLWRIPPPPYKYDQGPSFMRHMNLLAKFEEKAEVVSLAFASDAKLFVSGNPDGVRIWPMPQRDKKDTKLRVYSQSVAHEYSCPTPPTQSVGFLSPREVVYRTAGDIYVHQLDSTLNLSTKKTIFKPFKALSGGTNSGDLPPPRYRVHINGRLLVTGTDAGHIEVYNVPDARADEEKVAATPTMILKHHQSADPIRAVAVSSNHAYVVCVSDRNYLFIWRKKNPGSLTEQFSASTARPVDRMHARIAQYVTSPLKATASEPKTTTSPAKPSPADSSDPFFRPRYGGSGQFKQPQQIKRKTALDGKLKQQSDGTPLSSPSTPASNATNASVASVTAVNASANASVASIVPVNASDNVSQTPESPASSSVNINMDASASVEAAPASPAKELPNLSLANASAAEEKTEPAPEVTHPVSTQLPGVDEIASTGFEADYSGEGSGYRDIPPQEVEAGRPSPRKSSKLIPLMKDIDAATKGAVASLRRTRDTVALRREMQRVAVQRKLESVRSSSDTGSPRQPLTLRRRTAAESVSDSSASQQINAPAADLLQQASSQPVLPVSTQTAASPPADIKAATTSRPRSLSSRKRAKRGTPLSPPDVTDPHSAIPSAPEPRKSTWEEERKSVKRRIEFAEERRCAYCGQSEHMDATQCSKKQSEYPVTPNDYMTRRPKKPAAARAKK